MHMLRGRMLKQMKDGFWIGAILEQKIPWHPIQMMPRSYPKHSVKSEMIMPFAVIGMILAILVATKSGLNRDTVTIMMLNPALIFPLDEAMQNTHTSVFSPSHGCLEAKQGFRRTTILAKAHFNSNRIAVDIVYLEFEIKGGTNGDAVALVATTGNRLPHR